MRVLIQEADTPLTKPADEFEAIIESYQSKVFRLVSSILGPGLGSSEAEDVTQEVFLQVFLNLSRFRGQSALGTWIYSIARNRAIDRRRAARNRHHTDLSQDCAVPGTNLDHNLEIARAMDKLPEVYRMVVHLYYWQQSSLEEMSEMTGIKQGTLKSYLARARQNLEAILNDRKREAE